MSRLHHGWLVAAVLFSGIGRVDSPNETVRFYAAVNPLIQVFKPVSPLAWLPIVMILVSALYTSEDPFFEK